MIRLILTDFDGTLLPKSGGVLLPEFTQKIKNLTDKGVLFAVNSGRSYKDLKKRLSPLSSRTFFICNDGAQIMFKNCLVYKKTLCKKAVKKLAQEALKLGFSAFGVLREETLPITDEVLVNVGLFGEEIYKIIMIKNGAGQEKLSTLKELATSMPIRVCFEDDTYLEFCSNEATKGNAAAFLKKKYGITNGILAFGDSEYDFSMFQEADKVFIVKSQKGVYYNGAKIINSMQDFVIEEV